MSLGNWQTCPLCQGNGFVTSSPLNFHCDNHQPVQHRDGKPPWCKVCGLTKDFKTPVSRFKQEE